MALTVAEIASRLGGSVEGDGSATIYKPAGIREAQAGEITYLANPKYSAAAEATAATAVIVAGEWQGKPHTATMIRVLNPEAAFVQVVTWFALPPADLPPGIHPTAVVAAGVELGADVRVGPYCVIEGGVRIGDRTRLFPFCYVGQDSVAGPDCRFYPHVSIREYTRIGSRVILHNGAVIGSDGFGYRPEGKRWIKIPQTGVVEIGDDVEIGANTTVDRARFGVTRIRNGVKIDNLCQIAHNVIVGENTAMAAQVGISGSTIIGAHCQLGGQVGVAGHLVVGDEVVAAGQTGFSKDVPPGRYMFGSPAVPLEKAVEQQFHVSRLPKLKAHVQNLEKRLQELESKLTP